MAETAGTAKTVEAVVEVGKGRHVGLGRRLLSNRRVVIGGSVLLFFVLVALFAR